MNETTQNVRESDQCVAAVSPATERKFFVVTGTSVKDTGICSFRFLGVHSSLCDKLHEFGRKYAWLKLRKKGVNEISNPFKAVRGEGGVGDDGVKMWEVFVFEVRHGQIMTGGAEEKKGGEDEAGLKAMINDWPNCAILMERDIFPRFEKACQELGIGVGVYHHDGELATS